MLALLSIRNPNVNASEERAYNKTSNHCRHFIMFIENSHKTWETQCVCVCVWKVLCYREERGRWNGTHLSIFTNELRGKDVIKIVFSSCQHHDLESSHFNIQMRKKRFCY